jgi:hypothetical protein
LRALRRLMRANQFAAVELGARTAQQMIRRENRDHAAFTMFIRQIRRALVDEIPGQKRIAARQYVKNCVQSPYGQSRLVGEEGRR